MKELHFQALSAVLLFCILQGSNSQESGSGCTTLAEIFDLSSEIDCEEDLQYSFFGGLGVIVFLLLLVLLLLIIICCLAHRNRKMRR